MGCSNCGQIGHNLTTCNGKAKAVMLFGVNLLDKKPGQEQEHQQQCCCTHPKNVTSTNVRGSDNVVATTVRERKRDGAWTEDEHQRFLLGLKKLGRGDWAGIAKEFVLTRDSRQVASHGQKHFKRLAPLPSTHMKRRHSIFDMSLLPHQGSAADTTLPETSSQVEQVDSTFSATEDNTSSSSQVADQIRMEKNHHAPHAFVHDGQIMFAPGSYNYNLQSPISYPIYYQWLTHPPI